MRDAIATSLLLEGKMRHGGKIRKDMCWPDWVPCDVLAYLDHTLCGRSIRAIARDYGCQPSTILRRVRRLEGRRDDMLIDLALNRLEQGTGASHPAERGTTESSAMNQFSKIPSVDDRKFEAEAHRVLRRLSEQGAVLALAPAMETAVVVREVGDGAALRTAVVQRPVAEAMALREWIESSGEGRILRYRITALGRAELKRLMAQEESQRARTMGTANEDDDDLEDIPASGRRGVRYNLAESPLLTLARRRDADGRPFLSRDLVAAGERLREDFELAQMGTDRAQNWERFLTGPINEHGQGAGAPAAVSAQSRVSAALSELGPGLGDVALRCCCHLEGLETAERKMGWSARSGKIVLRIALQRLKQYYDSGEGLWSPLIGVD